MKKIIRLLVFSLLVFSISFSVHAESDFLVTANSTEDFYLLMEQRDRKQQPLPSKWKQISKAHYFKTKVKLGPKEISLKYNEEKARDGYEKKIAYWNRSQEKWVKLETVVEDGYLKASLKKKRAKVIALEKKTPQIKTFSEFDFSVNAKSAVAMDKKTGTVIYGKDMNTQRSMASLTKIMTAIVFLESGTSFDKEVMMSGEDFVYGNYVGLRQGDVVTAGDLFYSMLTASSNVSAYALARSTGMSMDEFVAEMNIKAQELGLEKTRFVEPSGLDEDNMTTAYEYALFAREALNSLEMLQGTTMAEYNFQTKSGRWLRAKTTNKLIKYGTDLYITGGKTGFTYEALYCLMLKTKKGDDELITVVLGEEASWDRFTDTEDLVNWVWDNAY